MKGPRQAPIRALRKAPARAQPRFSSWAARLRDADVIDRALADNTFDQAQEIVVTEVDMMTTGYTKQEWTVGGWGGATMMKRKNEA